ncbi:hypothetical protein [Paenibacillus rigui]|uniref:Post-SET domain-containing protein n=1 Tax=Paenibacillus rigui TaxID=554312 RepID=A0A229UWX7_9BACL|nr:hypothetical protein [Paenibacillus rigui]OXM87665.1 hypothetical protein CF651_04130 [Paenibacillus rigui]
MFSLLCSNWSWDKDLQIIHADVRLEIDGEILIDEPLCVDVGLPALLLSVNHEVEPNRWAPAQEWSKMPFFCCGCGDPECRGYSFRVKHKRAEDVELTELEEREGGQSKEMGSYRVPYELYKSVVHGIAREYLDFVEGLDYHPYFADTVKVVKDLLQAQDKVE